MIHYFLTFDKSTHQILIEVRLKNVLTDLLSLHLPLWRPGRYQRQNFAKNISNFRASCSNGILEWQKTGTNIWQIYTENQSEITIHYNYYAYELNAGSSFVNSDMIYLNPVNALMFLPELQNQEHRVTLPNMGHLPIATGAYYQINGSAIEILAKDVHHLFDCPFIISPSLEKHTFWINDIPFHFWIQGNYALPIQHFLNDLKKAAEYQVQLFGSFPEKEYHFLLIIPYDTYYHGVEHRNSTVMVIGERGILPEQYYVDLLGLASHELFHTWNICKIRPQELLPYDYTRENYFTTCFVAEGYTTYFGDKILLDSQAISKDQYRHELETLCKHHFHAHDQSCQSLLESSFDLWVDGYERGIPNKKVSVYHKGALAALILDQMIRFKLQNTKSLEDVMRKLYQEFGNLNKGYTYSDIQRICEEVYEESLQEYFDYFIAGNAPIIQKTKFWMDKMGYRLIETEEGILLENI